MKHIRNLLILVVALIFCSCGDSDSNDEGKIFGIFNKETVYICTGHSAKRYHRTKSCSGLGNCKASIEEVSKSEAKEMGRTPCKKCYN